LMKKKQNVFDVNGRNKKSATVNSKSTRKGLRRSRKSFRMNEMHGVMQSSPSSVQTL
jgi:hypothetical protein